MCPREPEVDQGGNHSQHAHFCSNCGARLDGGKFCGDCGEKVVAASDSPLELVRDDQPTRRMPARESEQAHEQVAVSASSDSGSKAMLIVGVIALLLAVAIGAFLLLSGGETKKPKSGSRSTSEYAKQLGSEMAPVFEANEDVSEQLAKLRGVDRADAKFAVEQAQKETTKAIGAVGALKAPKGGDNLRRDARQILEQEQAWLNAVAVVLANPSSSLVPQVPVLASSLSDSLADADDALTGGVTSVEGSQKLVAWAPRAARTLRNQGDGSRSSDRQSSGRNTDSAQTSNQSQNNTSGRPASGGYSSNPYANGRSCGGGVYAGPNTSCSFAINVRDAYYQTPGTTTSVVVYSPVTGRNYTMYCTPAGSGITCTGGNDASVAF